MEPIRVLQVVSKMNMGGAENFIMNIYRNIDRNLVQFDFISHGKGIFDDEIEELGGKIYYLNYINKIGPYKYKKQLRNFFKEHNEYSIIHSHVNQTSGAILSVAKECNINVRIAHSHSTGTLSNFFIRMYKRKLQDELNDSATLRIACSDAAGKWLFRESKYIVINNGIDVNKFLYSEQKRNILRKELKISNEKIVIGHVGRFSKVKNHKFLLECFKKLLSENNNYVLILLGDGELKNDIVNYVEKLNLNDNVIMLGNKKNACDYYNVMDLFVFPSLYEGIPLTLIEAASNGLKVFCSDTIDNRFIGINGFNYLKLSDGTDYWVNRIRNEEGNFIRISINRDFIEQYDIHRIANTLQKIYLQKDY